MENKDIDKHYTAFCSVCGQPMPVFAKEKPSDDTVFTHNKCKQLADIDKAARECALKRYPEECGDDAYEAGLRTGYRNGYVDSHISRQSEIDELIEALEGIKKEWDECSSGNGFYCDLEISVENATQLLEKYRKK